MSKPDLVCFSVFVLTAYGAVNKVLPMVNTSTTEKPKRQRRPVEVRQAELRQKLDRIENREVVRICRQMSKIAAQLDAVSESAKAIGHGDAFDMSNALSDSVKRWVAQYNKQG